MAKKNMTEEQRIAKEELKSQKRAARHARWEKFKDGFCEVGGAMLPIVAPLVLIIGASAASSKKSERKSNEYNDLLAKGLGYEGRKDPKYIAALYTDSLKTGTTEESSSDTEE